MRRRNRKSGLQLTPTVFGALHRALIIELKKEYGVAPETLVDYQLYGFNYYDENLPSIKKLILDKTGKWVNGKYIYNKYREWKKGVTPIQFTRDFVFVYFKTLGYTDINDFLTKSSLSDTAIAEQSNLEKPISTEIENEYYVGYFIGEEDETICTRLTLSETNLKAQWALAYWEEEKDYSEYIYDGVIQHQQNGMSLVFKNENTLLDRSLFVAIFCERHAKVKPFLVGAYCGYDRNRQPTIGEVIFQRVSSEEEQINQLSKKKFDPIISQRISGRRWTIEGKAPQTISALSAQSQFAHVIEDFVKQYKGIFVAIENGIFVFELSIDDNIGNASLSIAGHPLYKGIIKIQASGQLLIGRFTNMTTHAPLFISIEVLPIVDNVYTGDLLGISRFDKSFSGKIYLSHKKEFIKKIPKYRGSEITPEEIQKLPESILNHLKEIFENSRLERHFQKDAIKNESKYISHLTGKYIILFQSKQKRQTPLHLNILGSGKTILTHQHLTYEGEAMMCEGGVLSMYFQLCNGIPHCGQIVATIGRKSKNKLKSIPATWFTLDEDFQPKTIRIVMTPE